MCFGNHGSICIEGFPNLIKQHERLAITSAICAKRIVVSSPIEVDAGELADVLPDSGRDSDHDRTRQSLVLDCPSSSRYTPSSSRHLW